MFFCLSTSLPPFRLALQSYPEGDFENKSPTLKGWSGQIERVCAPCNHGAVTPARFPLSRLFSTKGYALVCFKPLSSGFSW